jgi:hypothetical protein
MSWLRTGWHHLRSWTRSRALEHRLQEEIRFHIDQQAEKNLQAGMSEDEARRRAFVQFGGVDRTTEAARHEFRPILIQDTLQDLRHGARALRRAPTFTLVAVLTLALGIGATTAVFTVVRAVLIEPLPFPDAGELVSLKHTSRDANGGPPVGMSASLLITYAKENRSFRALGVWSRGTENVNGDGVPEEVTSLNVSAGMLPALGIQPAMGRWFSPNDETPGTAETAMLTHGYWQRRFGRRPVGHRATADGQRANADDHRRHARELPFPRRESGSDSASPVHARHADVRRVQLRGARATPARGDGGASDG